MQLLTIFLKASHCVKKCPYSELLWFIFSRIETKYGQIRSISPYLVLMQENTDQNNSKYGHFHAVSNIDSWCHTGFWMCLYGIMKKYISTSAEALKRYILYVHDVKVGLSLSTIVSFVCFNECPVKLINDGFYFILKNFFVLKNFKFLSWDFCHVGQMTW